MSSGGARRSGPLPATASTARQVASAAPGLTARQLEYWVSSGWVVPAGRRASGHPREFSEAELAVIAVMWRLSAAGFPATLAARIARAAVEDPASRQPSGACRVRAGDGIYVTIYL